MENKEDRNDLTSEQEKALFSNLEFKYSRSKEDVWNVLDKVTSEESKEVKEEAEPTQIIAINWRVWSVAASVVLILTAGLFARLYKVSVEVMPGEFTSHTLPDGSEVHLNAESSIAYNPYWWRIDRGVEMRGEAYFVVAKGKKFSVHTELGTTTVLGTEFNVYARGNVFEVFCQTGSVKVTSESSGAAVVLKPGELAKTVDKEVLKQVDQVPQASILSWRVGQFMYNTTPLTKVLEDIERHYAVKIGLENKEVKDRLYTGVFKRNISLEDALTTVCAPQELIFEKKSNGEYLIKKK